MLSDLARAVGAWAEGAGGLGVLVVAVLDSSLLALPNATDALIMYLTIRNPVLWWYYAAMGITGVVIGSSLLYLLARRGGQSAIARRLTANRTTSLVGWYDRSAFLGIAGPAFLPPPFPLKIFILLAGAAAYPLWRVCAALVIGRGARHGAEAALAAIYRDRAVQAFEAYGPELAVASLAIVAAVGLVSYLRRRRRVA
jgi:membrane protein YqaA with SNARE-associated domain